MGWWYSSNNLLVGDIPADIIGLSVNKITSDNPELLFAEYLYCLKLALNNKKDCLSDSNKFPLKSIKATLLNSETDVEVEIEEKESTNLNVIRELEGVVEEVSECIKGVKNRKAITSEIAANFQFAILVKKFASSNSQDFLLDLFME